MAAKREPTGEQHAIVALADMHAKAVARSEELAAMRGLTPLERELLDACNLALGMLPTVDDAEDRGQSATAKKVARIKRIVARAEAAEKPAD